MQKNFVHLEIEKEERLYCFECPNTSPLGEVYDVLVQMQFYILEKMKEATSKKEDKDVNSSI